jgi:hypothetical protein
VSPLARRVALQSTLPPSARSLDDPAGLLTLPWDELLCFETSNAPELSADQIGDRLSVKGGEELVELPAPRIWVEQRSAKYKRAAFLFTAIDRGKVAFNIITERPFATRVPFVARFTGSASAVAQVMEEQGLRPEFAVDLARPLVLINAPEFPRRERAAARDLQRRLARARQAPGLFALPPWFEFGAA